MKSYKGTEEDKTLSLLQVWASFKSAQEREWWVKSLPLDQRALVRKALKSNTNKLF
jgi:hypothetical protein